ncbi:DNA polymerase III subunit tau [Candidatus Hepatoplasma crinochetorum Av]|uniref:DNA polymerase III subunit gamma/tau n=1 Tax=Candidatus Hepatoplasma crinochetorum Av TaxID=1427984 RepID=W8GGG6_9MOLU|nr:DNA polymerase III subunit gamma/tau [Candidatus Hepatoplasma crinochetorum]AHK22698.1 DNA polymerase III subunit tau [Candidatus Hepatoplasma crinochetorum Av]
MTNSLYIKYRPKNFDQICGQKIVKQILINSILQNKINHAYLFYGIRGVGKTTLARVFAKSINCKERSKESYNPCNNCQSCNEINSFSSFDVIEIDAASNNGVDEIRDIKEKANYATTNSFYKIYIIDEIHMLSKSAFNALLKTLEEPPEKTIFLLATTEINKIPETVLSRLIILNLETLSEKEIFTKLTEIAEQEEAKILDDSLKYVAKIANGSLRDAISYLETIFLYSKELNQDKITKILGILPDNLLNLYLKDNQKMLNFIQKSEVDFKNFLLILINYLTDQILEKNLKHQKLLNNLINLSINVKDPYLLKLSLINLFINNEDKDKLSNDYYQEKENNDEKISSLNIDQEEKDEIKEEESLEEELSQEEDKILKVSSLDKKEDLLFEEDLNEASILNEEKEIEDAKTKEIENFIKENNFKNLNTDFEIKKIKITESKNDQKVITDFVNIKHYLTVLFDYNKKKTEKFVDRFNYLSSYINKKNVKKYVSVLLEGKILVSSKDSIIIFGLPNPQQYTNFKIFSLEETFLDFTKELFGENVILLPILSSDWNKLNIIYKKLRSEDKKVAEKIKIDQIVNEEAIAKYKKIFGDKLEIINS